MSRANRYKDQGNGPQPNPRRLHRIDPANPRPQRPPDFNSVDDLPADTPPIGRRNPERFVPRPFAAQPGAGRQQRSRNEPPSVRPGYIPPNPGPEQYSDLNFDPYSLAGRRAPGRFIPRPFKPRPIKIKKPVYLREDAGPDADGSSEHRARLMRHLGNWA